VSDSPEQAEALPHLHIDPVPRKILIKILFIQVSEFPEQALSDPHLQIPFVPFNISNSS